MSAPNPPLSPAAKTAGGFAIAMLASIVLHAIIDGVTADHQSAKTAASTEVPLSPVTAAADAEPRQRKVTPAKTPKDSAVEFCRVESMSRMKYATVKWVDVAREQRPDVWLVSGIRTAKGPTGNVDQQYTCRINTAGGSARLELLQIFKESSTTGRDVILCGSLEEASLTLK